MADKKYVHALAGLVADPLLAGCQEEIIPGQWLQPVRDCQPVARQAGRLAAGASQEAGKGDFKTPLLSVFSSIQTAEGNIPEKVYWPQAVLKLDEQVVMPRPSVTGSSAVWDTFLQKARELKAVYENAPDETLPAFIESLLNLLQLHAWCLPCSYQKSLPDVSLYDHSRMTAALASALAEHKEGEAALAQLIGGDLSGVQRFIYTITARGATSSLRGRSFYLQMLTEATARYVLQELGLPLTSLIYAGGGNFYILAPASADLSAAREYISRVLLQHQRGELYLAVASLQLQEKDFSDGKIAARWQDLAEELNRAKLRTFSELGPGLDKLFKPQGNGGSEEALCQVCGLEHSGTVEKEKVRKCPPCEEFEQLGKDLRQAHFMVYRAIQKEPLRDETTVGDWKKVLAHLGCQIFPVDELGPLNHNGGAMTILALDDESYGELKPAIRRVTGRRFMVNVTPIITAPELRDLRGKLEGLPDPGSVKPFDVLEAQAKGIKRLGILRMDVDNLSKIFREGFGGGATLSRLGALSFAVSLFFEGWVARLAREANEQDKASGLGERIYSIYSGGDDLFFVGSWDAVIELARKIRADLSRYAGKHPGIHASAGVVLTGGKYPLYQAAQDAGQAEEQAKEAQWADASGEHTKDAVNFLGQTVPWQQFGLEKCDDTAPQTVHAWMHRLVTALSKDNTPRALLGLLLGLQEKYDKVAAAKQRQGTDLNQQRQKQAIWGPWNWQSAYFLRRMQKRAHEQGFKNLLEDILNLLKSDQFASIEWIGLAARWAELKLRSSSNH